MEDLEQSSEVWKRLGDMANDPEDWKTFEG
jgi:hypothetical protein